MTADIKVALIQLSGGAHLGLLIRKMLSKTDKAGFTFTMTAYVIPSFASTFTADINSGSMAGLVLLLELHLHILPIIAMYCISQSASEAYLNENRQILSS